MIKIETREIDYIQVIGESKNKILIVKQINSNRPVVVKSEETATDNMGDIETRNNVGAMLEFHGTMFSKLRSLPFDTEKLTLNEINGLRGCPASKVRGLKGEETWPAVLDSEVLKQHGRIKSVVKISYIEELANLSGMAKQYDQITLMRECLDHGDISFVFELGEILAVDFFIGNHDRFSERGTLRGPQNIFFQVRNGTIKATGIDTYDIFGRWSNLNKTIEELETANEKWPGRILSHGNVRKRDEIATKAVEEIIQMAFEGITGREGFPTPSTIGRRRKKVLITRFHKGMSEAKSTIRRKYSLTDNLSALQKGIASRWKIVRG